MRERLALLLQENGDFATNEAHRLAEWNPYDPNAVSGWLDSEWMFGVKDGFDIVIGNPPYIQLQNNSGALAKQFEKCGYKTFARTGDIYCLFYERGWQLLRAFLQMYCGQQRVIVPGGFRVAHRAKSLYV